MPNTKSVPNYFDAPSIITNIIIYTFAFLGISKVFTGDVSITTFLVATIVAVPFVLALNKLASILYNIEDGE